MRVRTATSIAGDRALDRLPLEGSPTTPEIEVIDFSRSTERPFGPRFGSLVHATLATVPLDANETVVAAVAAAQGRIIPTAGQGPYADEEVYAAVEVVTSLLKDPLFDRVRQAERAGRCDRELPIIWKAPDGTLIEGTIDLAFEDLTGLTVIDFKTDRELATDLDRYRRQLTVYCQALGTLRGNDGARDSGEGVKGVGFVRILDEDNDRSCGSLTLFLTKQEAFNLSAAVAALLDGPLDRHEHVDSDDFKKELTVCIYDASDLSGLNDRSRRLIEFDS